MQRLFNLSSHATLLPIKALHVETNNSCERDQGCTRYFIRGACTSAFVSDMLNENTYAQFLKWGFATCVEGKDVFI